MKLAQYHSSQSVTKKYASYDFKKKVYSFIKNSQLNHYIFTQYEKLFSAFSNLLRLATNSTNVKCKLDADNCE